MQSYTLTDPLDKTIEVDREKILSLYVSAWNELKDTFTEEAIGSTYSFMRSIYDDKRRAITDREIHNLYVFFNCKEVHDPISQEKLNDLIKKNKNLPGIINTVNEYIESRRASHNPIQIQGQIKPKIITYIKFNWKSWQTLQEILRFVEAEIDKPNPKSTIKKDEILKEVLGITYNTLKDWLKRSSKADYCKKVDRTRIQTLLQSLSQHESYAWWEESIGTKVNAIRALLEGTPEKQEKEKKKYPALRIQGTYHKPPVPPASEQIKITSEQLKDLRSLFNTILKKKGGSIKKLCNDIKIDPQIFRATVNITEISVSRLDNILRYYSHSDILNSVEDKEKIDELKKLLEGEASISDDRQQSTANKRKAESSEEELPAKLSKQETKDSVDDYDDETLKEGSVSENQCSYTFKENRSTLFSAPPIQTSYPKTILPEVLEDNILPELPMDLPIDSILPEEPVNNVNNLLLEEDDFSFGMSTPKLS